jgi:hypothetical protein
MEGIDQLSIPIVLTPKESPEYPVGMRLGGSKNGLMPLLRIEHRYPVFQRIVKIAN